MSWLLLNGALDLKWMHLNTVVRRPVW